MVFAAVTANVYAVLGCKPSKVKVPPVAWLRVRVNPPGVEVAVYEVTAEPPVEAEAPKLTVALRLPVVVAITDVGAEGAPTVVIELEALDAEPVPAELVALTVNVYAVPAVKPAIEIVPLPACEIDPVIPPGDEVAVYEVIAAPPLEAGAVKETFAVVAPVVVAITDVGAPGADAPPDVVMELEAREFRVELPPPYEYVAPTINV